MTCHEHMMITIIQTKICFECVDTKLVVLLPFSTSAMGHPKLGTPVGANYLLVHRASSLESL